MMSTKRLQMHTSTTTERGGELPGDILHDIFCRVPVQSLSQCRFVCKQWYNLIVNNTPFVDLYNSRQQSAAASLFVVRHTTRAHDQIFYLVDINQNNSTTSPLKASNVYFDWHKDTIDLVGSSNGLLCLCSLPTYDRIYILNPVTREILKLPKPTAQNRETNDSFKITFMGYFSAGFAFHAPTNTYKVVLTWHFLTKYPWELQTGIGIYTVGSGIWRMIDQGNISHVLDENTNTSHVYLNGALHLKMEDHIGAIDLGDENFTTFQQPSLDRVVVKTRKLSSLHQYLCLTDDFDYHIDIWVMKQYGVAESWSKEHVILKEKLPRALQRKVSVNTSIATKKNRCTVLLQGGEFNVYKGYYDLENHEYKEILIHGIQPPGNNLDFVLHNGSLMSPKSIAGTGEDYQCPSTISTRLDKYRLKSKRPRHRFKAHRFK